MGKPPISPWDYAQRYLPLTIPKSDKNYSINISRYRLSPPEHTTPEQQRLLGTVIDLFSSKSKDLNYRLQLTVNGATAEFANRHEIGRHLQVPFLGKGSPEDCQIVLQMALMTGGVSADRLQEWADTHLGLDCNGYLGNYLFREVQDQGWRVAPTAKQVGPSTKIDQYFRRWGDTPIEDLATVSPNRKYLIVRVDGAGQVIPQWAGKVPGHCAITQPGEVLNQTTATDEVGEQTAADAKKLGMVGKFALRTVESGGPIDGVGRNWMFFIKPGAQKGVFLVNRDKVHLDDKIRIAPLLTAPRGS